MDPMTIAFGLGVGVLVGLTGMGGGTLMTPLLIIVLGVKPVVAVGTDIGYAAVTKTVGGIKHLRQGTVDLSLSAYMAIGSVPAALIGVIGLQIAQDAAGRSFDGVLIVALSAVLLLTGVAILARLLLIDVASTERTSFGGTRRDKLGAVAIGVFVGFILGVTSAGSGALIGVALILVFRLVPTRVVGTDVFHASILLWAAAIAHGIAGNIDYALAGTLLLGSVPGVWIGSHLSVRVPVQTLRAVLGLVLLGSGLGLLTKAGVPVPAPVIAAVPLIVGGAIVYGVTRRGRLGRPTRARERGDRVVPDAA
jgi:uncharacterized membrane protein YfcA